MRFGAEVDRFTVKGGGGHAAVIELVGGGDLQFGAGFDDEGFALLIGEVDVSVGQDGRG